MLPEILKSTQPEHTRNFYEGIIWHLCNFEKYIWGFCFYFVLLRVTILSKWILSANSKFYSCDACKSFQIDRYHWRRLYNIQSSHLRLVCFTFKVINFLVINTPKHFPIHSGQYFQGSICKRLLGKNENCKYYMKYTFLS